MEEKKRIPVKPNDLKAPRFSKAEFIHEVVNRKLYETWKKDTGNTHSFKEFQSIWRAIAGVVREQVVNNPHGVRLPFFNGDILANYYQHLNRHTNRPASQQVGYLIPELDWHSNQKQGKVVWSIRHARKQHRWLILFAFEPCRKLKRAVATGFKTHPEIYKYSRATNYTAYKLIENERRQRHTDHPEGDQ